MTASESTSQAMQTAGEGLLSVIDTSDANSKLDY